MDASPEMREPTFLLLTALAGGRRHGYALIRDVADISDGRVQLRAGTLYAALSRLVDQGLAAVDGEEVVNSRLRRYYRLTPVGADELEQAARQRRATADVATARLTATAVTA